MTSVPVRIVERRAELDRMAAWHHAELQRIAAERAGVDLCIAAIEDAAKTPSAEVGEGVTLDADILFEAAESSPAGSAEALSGIEPMKFRRKNRNIAELVLDVVQEHPRGITPVRIARRLGDPLRVVEKHLACWQDKGRLTLDGGVVRLAGTDIGIPILPDPEAGGAWTLPPEDQLAEIEAAEMAKAIGRVEIIGQVEGVAEDGITYGVGGLVAFLQAEPDSTMAEINAAGIPASEVHRAEEADIVIAKAHGLYALAEPQQSEAAE